MASSGRKIGLIPGQPGMPGYSEDLRARAEDVLNGTNLVEVILYSHLLLEQALDLRIQACFKQPQALENPKMARLSFAQKLTVYAGLYDPDPEQIALLQAVNRLRNRMAHSLADIESATLEYLPAKHGSSAPGTNRTEQALDRVQGAFLWLALFELGAVQGASRLNRKQHFDPEQ